MKSDVVPNEENIRNKIHTIRGKRVMLDRDLAVLYNIETRALKQAVKRNKERFPKDFMFILTKHEVENMVSQNVIPSKKHLGGALPYAFTEQGVAMLSRVLRSKKATLKDLGKKWFAFSKFDKDVVKVLNKINK